ncbi:MAG: tetratricopeptide repeat protein [Burkholderiaceae bacterium]
MMRVLKKLIQVSLLLFGLMQIVYAEQKKDLDVNIQVVLAAMNKGDITAATQYLLPLAKSGHAEAQFLLVSVLRSTDQKQATEWLIIAAKNKYPDACHILGLMYMDGNGMPQDKAEGENFLRCAADGGSPGAQVALGMLYRNGATVSGKRDDEQAAELFNKAADQGSPEAQLRLAEMYRYGYGIKKDQAEAERLLRLAQKQGNMEAQKMLVEMGK